MALHLYVPPSLRHFEPRRLRPPRVEAHPPFEYDLVHALRPRLVVDLGAGEASSFFTYCQSAHDHDIDAVCYAADDWSTPRVEGGPDFQELSVFARRYYVGMANFVPEPPENLLAHFGPGAIDLLRIDGALPAVRLEHAADWMSRMRAGGVVAMHGVRSGEGRLWAALTGGRAAFELDDLGVVVVPKGARDAALLRLLDEPDEHAELRAFYAHVGEHHRMRRLTDLFQYLGPKRERS